MLVTSAGVSRGDYDVVKDVLAKEGEVDFWTVRMRPGKPLAFGTFPSGGRRVPHIGLPGNPVSSMVSFELFGRPAIYKMLGRADWERPCVRAIADEAHREPRRPPLLRPRHRHPARRPLPRRAHRPAGLRHPHLDGRSPTPSPSSRRISRRSTPARRSTASSWIADSALHLAVKRANPPPASL